MYYFEQADFNPGGIRDRFDSRDYQWHEVGNAIAPFDWSKTYDVEEELSTALSIPSFKLPVKDQGLSGSCGGQSWANYGGALEAIATGSFEERSAKFIYAQTYVNQPGGGSAGRDNSELVKKQGWGLESLTSSYDQTFAPSEEFMERAVDITDTARQIASKSRALSYLSINTSIDDVAQACKANHGAIIGIAGANNGTWRSNEPMPPKKGGTMWYHWLYVGKAGMYNGKKAIKVFNSWGSNVGDNGWQWLTEDYLNAPLYDDRSPKTIWSAWTLVYNSSPAPVGFHYTFNVNMAFGDQNEEVRMLQRALSTTGDFTLTPTGYYGNATAAAVFKFQMRMGISPADRFHAGPRTRAFLNQKFS